eukprot:scaffold30_cov416-Prasinococcus_capsulatus_cf.AAC.15
MFTVVAATGDRTLQYRRVHSHRCKSYLDCISIAGHVAWMGSHPVWDVRRHSLVAWKSAGSPCAAL